MFKKCLVFSLVVSLCTLGPSQSLFAAEVSSGSTDSAVIELQEPETETEVDSDKETDPQTEETEFTIQSEDRELHVSENSVLSDEQSSESLSEEEIPDYTLGRPMTEEEIARQKSLLIPNSSLQSSDLPPLTARPSRARAALPVSYDGRKYGYVTPVRLQGMWNTCWSFASLACAESSLLRKGLADSSTLDLSERHFAYFFYFTKPDPLGLTSGDHNAPNQPYLEGGGNNIFSIFSFAKWIGAADESLLPYTPYTMPSAPSEKLAYQNRAHLQNAFLVPSSSVSDMKSLVLNYGAVAVNVYMDSTDYWNYYNPQASAYCYKPDGPVANQNHTLTIVGWNDNYSRNNFLSSKRPKKNGAWLAKNSWGTSWGDDGYVWISYEDAFLQSSAANGDAAGYVYDFESADNYDHNYQYDGTSNAQYLSFTSPVTISNVYTIQGSRKGTDESLEAVSFAHYTPGVSYSIQIYKNPKKSSDPTSGTAMLKTPQTGSCAYAGYQTIPLTQKVNFKKGDVFSVVIRLTPPSGQTLNIFTDSTRDDKTWIQFIASSSPKQSFLKADGSSGWTDVHSLRTSGSSSTIPSTIRIKAFTKDLATTSVNKMSITSNTSTPGIGRTASLKAAITPAKATYSNITWTSSNTNVIQVKTTGKNQTTAAAVGYGTAVVTARTNTGAKATIKLTVNAPGFSKLSSGNYRSIKLSWTKVPKASGYVLYRSTSRSGNYKQITTLKRSSTTSYTDQKLSTGKTYYYQIRSYTKSGKKTTYSSYSSRRSCTPVPAVVTLRSVSKDGNKLALRWKAVSGASGYEVYRSTSKSGTYKRIKTLAGKSSISYLTSYKKNTTYYYKVRAYRTVSRKKIYGGFSTVRNY